MIRFPQIVPSLVHKISGRSGINFTNAASTPSREAAEGIFTLLKAFPSASPYDFLGRLQGALVGLDNHFRYMIDDRSSAMLIGASTQLAYDYLKELRPDYAVHGDKIAAAVSSVLDIMSRYLNQAAVSGEFSWASALGVQSLQRTLNSVSENVDTLLVAADALLTKGLNSSTLSKQPSPKFCSERAPLSSYLILDAPGHFAELEAKICSNLELIFPEMAASAPVKEILALFGEASLSNVTDNSASWKDIASRLLLVRKSLANFDQSATESLRRSLEPFSRFISGVRVLLGVPATKMESLRLKTRALEIALDNFLFDDGAKSMILKLIEEMSRANELKTIPENSHSILLWSEKNLPEFTGLFIRTAISKPDKIRAFFQRDLSENCQQPVETILELGSDSEIEQEMSDKFNDLCERLLSSNLGSQTKFPTSVLLRKLFDSAANFWNLASTNQVSS